MEDIYSGNSNIYKKKYDEGYGLQYPDGHIIRIYERVLKHELNLKKGNILDFGCGIGTHLKYFQERGFTPFGVDIVSTAVKKAKLLLPDFKDNIHVTEYMPNLRNYFSESFDVIFSNQVLYFLNDVDIKNICKQFLELLKPNGVFFATMVSPKCVYQKYVESKNGEMSRVVLNGRVTEIINVNIKTEKEVLDIFSGFKKTHFGYYDVNFTKEDESSHHWIFIGRKE